MTRSPEQQPPHRWEEPPDALSEHPMAIMNRARTLAQETEPFDHPWREARVDAHHAEFLASAIRTSIKNLGDGDQRRAELVNGADRELLNRLDECKLRISSLFKLGLRLLVATEARNAEVSRAADLRGRQLQHILSPQASDVVDPRMRRAVSDPIRLRAPNRDHPRHLESALRIVHGKAQRIANSNPPGAFPRNRQAWEYFFYLRSAAEDRDEVKLMVIGMLHEAGYTWTDVGDAMGVSGQWAHDQYGERLRTAARESAVAPLEEKLWGEGSCRHDTGFD